MMIFVEKINRYFHSFLHFAQFQHNVKGQCQVLHGTFIDFVRLKALQI